MKLQQFNRYEKMGFSPVISLICFNYIIRAPFCFVNVQLVTFSNERNFELKKKKNSSE
jgi:hypothetical protein